MKKILLTLLISFTVAACSSDKESNDESTKNEWGSSNWGSMQWQ